MPSHGNMILVLNLTREVESIDTNCMLAWMVLNESLAILLILFSVGSIILEFYLWSS